MDGRCPWCGTDPAMSACDDAGWGAPQRDGRSLFEPLAAEGFRFAGPTIARAFMQAAGPVNDPLATCPRLAAVAAMA